MKYEDMVPVGHRDLGFLRLFLPWTLGGEKRPWSSLLRPGQELSSQSDWHELATANLSSADLASAAPPDSRLPTQIAEFLHGVIDEEPEERVLSYVWDGYRSEALISGDRIDLGCGTLSACIPSAAFIAGRFPANLSHDLGRHFAFASLPYPDSIIIAAEPKLFRKMHRSDLLEVVSARRTDTVIVSSND